MSAFIQAIRRFVTKTDGKVEDAARKIVIDAFTEVILRSPVDTGRFRGNWQVAIGAVPDGALDLADPGGAATVSAVTAAAMGLKAGDVIYLANNLPYAMRLEYGHSSQAPGGMVRLTAARFQAIAGKVIAEVGRR